jgi:hypothetical protein
VEGSEPERYSHSGADDPTGDRCGGERHEDLEEALDQDTAIHTKNAADDDARDEQVQEIGVLGELRDRAEDGVWQ